MTSNGPSGDDVPRGWTAEERDDDIRSWLGPEERVVCVRESDGDEWHSYAVPRSELGAPSRTPLTDAPGSFDDALAAAQEYMRRNEDAA